jgi:hypothetical protein
MAPSATTDGSSDDGDPTDDSDKPDAQSAATLTSGSSDFRASASRCAPWNAASCLVRPTNGRIVRLEAVPPKPGSACGVAVPKAGNDGHHPRSIHEACLLVTDTPPQLRNRRQLRTAKAKARPWREGPPSVSSPVVQDGWLAVPPGLPTRRRRPGTRLAAARPLPPRR